MKISQMAATTFWKGESGVKALVEDQGQSYRAGLSLRGSQAYDYSCSCMQGNSYKGMCVHCQALYEEWKKQKQDMSGIPVMTSQQVRTMIREYTNREVAHIISEAEHMDARLLPALALTRDGIRAEFKIGREKYYLVKDLSAFAKAVDEGTYIEYGKSLAFHHGLMAFAEDNRKLVEFVTEQVNAYCQYYSQFQRGSFSAMPLLKCLNFNKAAVDRFFSIMKDQKLELSDHLGQKRQVTIVRRNPDLDVHVEKRGRDGIRVFIDKQLLCFHGEHRLYVADGELLYCCDESCSGTLDLFLNQMTEGPLASYETEINNKDMPLFYERVLKKIASFSVIHADGIDLESYKPEELKVRFEFDSPGRDELVLHPVLSYGDYSFQPVEDERLPRTVCRDVPGEFRVSQLITRYFKYKEYDTQLPAIRDDEDAVFRLLTEGMSDFMAVGEVYLSDSFRALKVLPPPSVSVGVKSMGSWLELSVDAGDMSGQELVKLLSEYSQKKKYYRLKSGEFLSLDDQGLLTVAKLAEGLAISRQDLLQKKFTIPKYRAFYLDSVLKEGKGITLYRDQLFKSVVRGMKSVEDSDFEIPPTLKEILRGYQKTGYRWLKTLDSYGFGGILADDMGLGKTIQIIALLLDEASKEQSEEEVHSRSLIICPASLIYNWENELHIFAPNLRAKVIAGSAAEREALLAEDADVLITSYDLLKRDVDKYSSMEFRYEVIDEAQFIKNAGTQSARAVKSIHAVTRFALTGTPVENRLSELWSIFDYLMPGFLFSYQRFKKGYEVPIVRDGERSALEMLHKIIGPFILRRLKKDVLKELPDKLETVVYSAFEKEQKELYMANAWKLKNQLESSGTEAVSDKLQILSELTRLRQICCDPHLCYGNYSGDSAKLETCMELLTGGVEGGHKILLFSQFTSMLEILEKRLVKEGIRFYKLTGSTPKEERLHMVSSFHSDDVPVFLISLKAGGTGLNLTAADIVIHYDPWWNVAAQNQATDRAHRIGQEKQVSVFKLITKGTIEENILRLQVSKQDLAEQIITEGTVPFSSLTRSDIIHLLD